MATAREGGEPKFSYSLGSEDFYDLVCQPCQLHGKLQEAIGMCVDCQEYLCQRCFDVHTLPTPSSNHKLLNKKQMIQQQVSLKKKDKCSEKCAVHEGEVIKYYCIDHCQLGCNDCITLNHRSCENVTYIPHAAKDLANNDEYTQAERLLESVVKRVKNVTEENKHKTESVERECSEAVRMVQEFRKGINEALNKIEAELVKKCKTLKSEELEKMTQIVDNLKTVQTDLQSLKAMAEKYQNNKQNCNLYTVMMKAKETLMLAEDRLTELEKEQLSVNSQIKFFPNNETLLTLRSSESFGKLSKSGDLNVISQQFTRTPTLRQNETPTAVNRREPSTIVRAEYVKDVNVKSHSDKKSCLVSGLVTLPGNKLFIADFDNGFIGNGNVKMVDVNGGQVITQLKLSSSPWDIAMVTDSQVAVTLPARKKVAIVNVSASTLTIDRTLNVSGGCWAVDYKDDKLAVSFLNPDKIQILTLQGQVLYSITNDNKQGQALFSSPDYVAFDKDNTSLYVSNYDSDTVVHVKFDGTVVGTFTDSKFNGPTAVLADSSGNVYVCGRKSQNIYQITSDCRKIQMLLTKTDGLNCPRSISYSKAEGRLYVGMYSNDAVKVFRVILGSK